MIRATTPTHSFKLPIGAQLVQTFLLTYAQEGKIVLEKGAEDMTVDGDVWSVTLTQEEANLFDARVATKAQVRVLTTDGKALASQIMQVYVSPVLNDEVLT